MRAVVLALTLALVAGQSHFVPKFDADWTYVYKYEMSLISGLPEENLAKSGLKMCSKVLISAVSEQLHLIEIIEPEIFELNGILSKNSFNPVKKLTSALKSQLAIPIKFEYNNGVIGQIMAPTSVSTMVLNIYRGILNVLQLKIKQTHNFYELQEAGVQGVCKTTYAIYEEEKAERIHVTKTRDLNHCQEAVIKDMGLAFTWRCAKCQQNAKSLSGSTAYDYILKTHAGAVQIMHVAANEWIQFAPLGQMNGAAQMHTHQELSFVEVQKTPINANTAQYVSRGSLKYELPRDISETPLTLVKISNLQAQVMEILNQLINNNVERAHENAPEQFLIMVQILRSARIQDLESLWRQSKKKPAHRQWILDSIAAVGTPAALTLAKEKFLGNEIRVAEMAQVMIASVHMVTATRETLEIFKEMVENRKITENPVLKEIVLLGYGTMMAKHCWDQAACPMEAIQSIHSLLAEAHSKNNIKEIILLLKVVGNAGLPVSIKPITKILPITHSSTASALPMTVHAEAIMALRNIAKKEPKMIQELAFQLYMDKTLDPELRMLACIVLFEAQPSVGLVMALANYVKTEENLQVASFTYSHMKSVSKSTSIINSSVAAACNVAIRMLSPKLNRLSLRFSRAIQLDTYNSPWMIGAAATAFYINSAASVLPRTVMVKARAYLSGAAADVLEVGVRTDGLQEVLLKNPTLISNEDRITKMRKAMKALSHWRSCPNAKPLASVYVKFMGQEIAFVNIDQSLIEQAIQLTKDQSVWNMRNDIVRNLVSGVAVNIVKPLLISEVKRIMPTAAGLPLELILCTAAVTAANARVKATITPALPENFQLSHLLETDIQLESEVRPSIALFTAAAMGINTAMFKNGIVSRLKFNNIVPAKIFARLNVNKGNFKMGALPVTLPENIIAMHIETLAVSRNTEDLSGERRTPLIPDQVHSPILVDPIMSQREESQSASSERNLYEQARPSVKSRAALVEKKRTVQILGLKWTMIMATKNAAFIRDVPLYRLAGTHSLVISITPAPGEAYDRLEVEVQVGPQAAQKLVKQIDLNDEETMGTSQPVLTKLQQLLNPAVNSTSSSSRSSWSRLSSNPSKKSSSSRSSSSGSSSSKSSSSSGRSGGGGIRSSKTSSSGSKSSSSGSKRSSSSGSKRSSKTSSSGSKRSSSGSSKSSSSGSRSSSSRRRRSNSKLGPRTVSRWSSSSSASNLASLISASSSSSQQSGRVTQRIIETPRFIKSHKKKTSIRSKAASSSGSSGRSFQRIYEQNKFLGNKAVPSVAVIAQAVRGQTVAGYQLAVYLDKPTQRIQLIVADLAPGNNKKICADAIVLSRHKVAAKIGYGAACEKYTTNITAEMGLVGPNPAARLKVGWTTVPTTLQLALDRVMKSIPSSILSAFDLQKNKNIANQASCTLIAPTEKTLDIILKIPMCTISKLGVPLPINLPLSEIKDLIPFDHTMDKIHFVLAKAMAAKCSYNQDTLTTFNNRRYTPHILLSCYQVLAQDCTDEVKFIVLMRSDHLERKHINVKIADIDIDLFPKGISIGMKVNGMEIPVGNLPYQHPKAKIQIRPKDEGISVYAPSLGLHEVYMDRNTLKVKVVDWMKGQTCGLCGRADGEIKQEFSTPSGFQTKNPVTYAYSWILPAESCKGTSECRLKPESIELEKQVVYGQESKCFSVQPVLRCLPGCFAVKTAPVTVDFHCVAAESNLNKSEVLRGIHEKSVDLRERAEAHLACSCTAQCV